MDFEQIRKLLVIGPTLSPDLIGENEVIQYSAKYDPGSVRAWGQFSTPREFSLKRYNEFLAGRYCIYKALNFEKPLAISESGGPEWPLNFCGSLTHSGDYVSVMVSSIKMYKSIGRDSEIIFDKKLTKSLEDLIISRSEKKNFDLEYEKFLTLAYSAKESLFKALYPLTGTFFDFLDAEFYAQNKSFSIKLKKDLNDNFKKGMVFNGSFEFSDGYVHTAILIPTD